MKLCLGVGRRTWPVCRSRQLSGRHWLARGAGRLWPAHDQVSVKHFFLNLFPLLLTPPVHCFRSDSPPAKPKDNAFSDEFWRPKRTTHPFCRSVWLPRWNNATSKWPSTLQCIEHYSQRALWMCSLVRGVRSRTDQIFESNRAKIWASFFFQSLRLRFEQSFFFRFSICRWYNSYRCDDCRDQSSTLLYKRKTSTSLYSTMLAEGWSTVDWWPLLVVLHLCISPKVLSWDKSPSSSWRSVKEKLGISEHILRAFSRERRARVWLTNSSIPHARSTQGPRARNEQSRTTTSWEGFIRSQISRRHCPLSARKSFGRWHPCKRADSSDPYHASLIRLGGDYF